MKNFVFLFLFLLICLASCSVNPLDNENITTEGVSRELATFRQNTISDVEYVLHFSLPVERDNAVTGMVDIQFQSSQQQPIVVDFAASAEAIHTVEVDGEPISYKYENEHIIIEQKYCRKGENNIRVVFTSPDKSLNRRDEFIYTLLVPDRARRLFPLFDQPGLKARYTLSLTLPQEWKGVGNSGVEREQPSNIQGYKTIRFNKSEPISSYLFAFVVGVFDVVEKERNGAIHRIYHRETDPQRTAQFDAIYAELFHSLDWLEEYTDVKYPFSKYDLVLVPGFQYGGMEHVGATIYNASTMFLSPTPTVGERLSRAELIAHETAHMWFGDYVTMEWFDDVWTKEVFANYFAAKIIAPLFPDMDSSQSMLSYNSAAMSEDRTEGGTSIKQNLDNLRYAGLIYNNIIYNKSPIVFEMLSEMVGEKAFQSSIRQYLKKFAYSCATWDQLVAIFDANSEYNIASWSRNWMYESGMPVIAMTPTTAGVRVQQTDSKGRGLLWGQKVSFMTIDEQHNSKAFDVYVSSADTTIQLDFKPKYVIPNIDGRGYGFFQLRWDEFDFIGKYYNDFFKTALERRILVNMMYENVLQQTLDRNYVLTSFTSLLARESDAIVFSSILRSLTSIYVEQSSEQTDANIDNQLDKQLWAIFDNNIDKGCKVQLFKTIYTLMLTPETKTKIYNIWSGRETVEDIVLGERDFINMSLELAVRYPDEAEQIVKTQLSRITNPDTREEYIFVSKAVSASIVQRGEFFTSLLDVKNRGVEKWVEKSLIYLNHWAYQDETRGGYIRPALDKLVEIQRTGDIFFPQGWCSSLLGRNNENEAYNEVKSYIDQTPTLHPLLLSKVLISSHHLQYKYGESKKYFVYSDEFNYLYKSKSEK